MRGETKMEKNRKKFLIVFSVFIILIIIIVFSLILFFTSFRERKEESIYFDETSNLSYKVWLKKNDFYKEKYLDKNYKIVASAIDNIEIDFDYDVLFSKETLGESFYKVDTSIIAYSTTNDDQKIWEQRDSLKDKKIIIYDKKTTNFGHKDSFIVDYNHYRQVMDEYRQNYGVSLVGKLVITIELQSKMDYYNKIELPPRTMNITIPLTESIITINETPLKKSHEKVIVKEEIKTNYFKLILSLFLLVINILLSLPVGKKLIKLQKLDSKYRKRLRKILRTYDSAIVSVGNFNANEDDHIMIVSSFEEILDAHSEYRVPILFLEDTPTSSKFIVKHNHDIFIYSMKEKRK